MTAKTKRVIVWSILLIIVLFYAVPAIKKGTGADFKAALDSVIPKDRNNFDFTETIISLSCIVDPDSDGTWAQNEIYRMSAELKPLVNADIRPESVMNSMNKYLFDTKGYILDEKANTAFTTNNLASLSVADWLDYDSIARVMHRKRGICLSLSLVYLMIADNLGLPIYGVVIPHHIFVRYQEPGHSGINSDVNYKGVEYYSYSEGSNSEFIDKSKVIYNKPLSRYETVAVALNNFGNLLFMQGHARKAQIIFEKSIQMVPDFPETHTNLGFVYMGQGREDKAETEFKKSIEIFPNDMLAYTYLGLLYKEQKRFLLAQENLEKALKLDPSNTDIKDALDSVAKERGK